MRQPNWSCFEAGCFASDRDGLRSVCPVLMRFEISQTLPLRLMSNRHMHIQSNRSLFLSKFHLAPPTRSVTRACWTSSTGQEVDLELPPGSLWPPLAGGVRNQASCTGESPRPDRFWYQPGYVPFSQDRRHPSRPAFHSPVVARLVWKCFNPTNKQKTDV